MSFINKIIDSVGKKSVKTLKDLVTIDVLGNGYALLKNGYLTTGIKIEWPGLFSLYENEVQDHIIKHITSSLLSSDPGTQVAFQNIYVTSESKKIKTFKNHLDESQIRNQPAYTRNHYSYIFISYPSSYNPSEFVIYDDDSFKRVDKNKGTKIERIPIDDYIRRTHRLVKSLKDSGLVAASLVDEKELKSYLRSYLSLNWINPSNVSISDNPTNLTVGDKMMSVLSMKGNPTSNFNHFSYPQYTTDFTNVNTALATNLPASFAHPLCLGLNCDHITTLSFTIHDDKKFKGRVNKHFKNIAGIGSVFDNNADKAEITKAFLTSVAENPSDRIVTYNLNVMVIGNSTEELRSNVELASRSFELLDLKYVRENFQNLTYYKANMLGNNFNIPRQMLSSVSRVNKLFPFETKGINSDQGILVQNKAGEYFMLDLLNKVTTLGNRPIRKTNWNMTLFGKTGSGKSNLLAYILMYLLNSGSHVTMIDKGNSFKKIFLLLKGHFKCRYYTWEENQPLAFNPFLITKIDGKYQPNKTDEAIYLKAMLVEIIREKFTKEDLEIITDLIGDYLLPLYYKMVNNNKIKEVNFNSFYEFITRMKKIVEKSGKGSEKDSGEVDNDDEKLLRDNFDFDKVSIAYRKFYKGGQFEFLFNAKENYSIDDDAFVLFELDRIQKDPFLFRIVSMCISQIQDGKLASEKLKSILKYLVIDEGTFMMNEIMGEIIAGNFQTVRKHGGGMIFTDQTIDKLVETGFANRIFGNSDMNVLLEQKWTEQTESYIRSYLEFTESTLRKVKAIDNSGPWREGTITMGGVTENFRLVLSPEYLLALNTDSENKANIRLLKLYQEFNNMETAIKQVIEEEQEV